MRTRWIGTIYFFLVLLGAFAALPDSLSAQRVGEVQGNVILEIPPQSAPTMLSPYARRRYSPPTPASQSASSPQSVVVYVVVNGRPAVLTSAPAIIRQRNRTITPAVTAVQKGSRIEFPNEDNVFHNLFSLSGTRPFNLGRYAPGASKSLLFDKAGVVRVFCDIHSEMSGTIIVLDTPFYTRPDENGSFVIRGVPEGRHTLVAWHETTGAISSSIVVTANGVTRADIRVPG